MFTMTKNVVRNLFTKSATRLYPLEVREPFAGYRGRLDNRIEDCIFCKTCQVKCPSQCITVDPKAGTWECDPFACVYCAICVDHCPVKCLFMDNHHRTPVVEREMIHLQGTPRKKKVPVKAAPAADAPEAAASADAATQAAPAPEGEAAPAPDAPADETK
ncbi:4Fe-4S dicluster domain-containing protein [Desulfolutivibrio sulfoxidireducens]|uniref:4Fe-4S dicluster domain-containing protein n=1 Tax=Desulfolutivibrio sulfoxidireducens TaxID=2773299 RepID=UPI00159E6042|nr:4Fe-4S dicluster domain-containing protein [Desulfolutivibrio sulfoxidireducens]QLA14890.1 4Fe-4S ferredoxin [Desulfolutivibrio sulfoxidireducens]